VKIETCNSPNREAMRLLSTYLPYLAICLPAYELCAFELDLLQMTDSHSALAFLWLHGMGLIDLYIMRNETKTGERGHVGKDNSYGHGTSSRARLMSLQRPLREYFLPVVVPLVCQ
jgi:hypothetical protein